MVLPPLSKHGYFMTTDIQDQIAKLWAQSLGVKNIAPDDSFFALGGHSLLGVKLVAAVQEKLAPDVELSFSDLLEHPTLAEFSGRVAELMDSGDSGTL
jgi:acyl carrier protein